MKRSLLIWDDYLDSRDEVFIARIIFPTASEMRSTDNRFPGLITIKAIRVTTKPSTAKRDFDTYTLFLLTDDKRNSTLRGNIKTYFSTL
ncbi:hypothetical protein NIES4072_23810 [Nostoc commune NIES-4072]|uniref:Uncharacterized protein n=1 Tax=Nostoc commune NIES-4072 TaxID=2005467 RepID=A0A2R5FIZ7_NOSCO|nr:hypothetical protein NIES4070_03050 [Nostoc commune HK-02]GBG18716.1 hypothetical protein NIES4072_23810 [Nostoc commune NIES-4072]